MLGSGLRKRRRGFRRGLPAKTATAVLVCLLAGAVPAAAAPPPPRHVIITNPGSHQAAALYLASDTYKALDDAIGWLQPQTPPLPGVLHGGDDRVITLSWLFQESEIWRVDNLYLDAPGGPWLQRYEARRGEPVSKAKATWHRTAHPHTLLTLLTLLDVAGVSSRRPGDPSAELPPNQNPLPPIDVGTVFDSAGDDEGIAANWWWSLPGAAGGALLALYAPVAYRRWQAARASPPETGPRQELIEL